MKNYTKCYQQILDYVYNKGGINVPMGINDVNQNKNYYIRINQLMNDGLFTIQKTPGMKSLYTLTELGVQTIKNYRKTCV